MYENVYGLNGARSEPTRDVLGNSIFILYTCVSAKISVYRKDMDPRVTNFRVIVNPRSFRKEERRQLCQLNHYNLHEIVSSNGNEFFYYLSA